MIAFDDWFKKAKAVVVEKASNVVFAVATSNLALAIPVGLFALIAGSSWKSPQSFAGPITLDLELPSEAAIPKFEAVRPIDPRDTAWRFRYAETGTEFRAGIPYWIFRALPRLMPERFGGRGYDWFGFDTDNEDYYKNPPLPRGLSLSDTTLRIPFLNARAKLKRVAINCSGCHRGEYLDEQGKFKFVDGMPNHTADLQGFKRLFATAFQDPRFDGSAVISTINQLLKEGGHAALQQREELIYRAMVEVLRDFTREPGSAWMDSRADNGPGRIDPFNAVKFEVLAVPDDGTAATLDFPAIWNQRSDIRSSHHYDGNTEDPSARNFGSVIGVGGVAFSVNRHSVNTIGEWLDELAPRRYPFAAPPPDAVQNGLAVFKERCVACHGLYDREANRVDTSASPNYMRVIADIGTDAERSRAFPASTANALNKFGFERALWPRSAFRSNNGGYLSGPLDGIWARAPYLHNGSVPNIDELLKPPEQRVKAFYRGNPAYDRVRLGWVADAKARSDDARPLFLYDTSLLGNSNQGHAITVEDPGDRANLIAYLKTL